MIELDVLTGEIEILRSDLLYDCGKSLSPEIDLGQVEGAFMIGVGHFLTEGLEYDSKSGALKTFDTWEYKPPQSLDIPIEWNTTLLKDVVNTAGFMCVCLCLCTLPCFAPHTGCVVECVGLADILSPPLYRSLCRSCVSRHHTGARKLLGSRHC